MFLQPFIGSVSSYDGEYLKLQKRTRKPVPVTITNDGEIKSILYSAKRLFYRGYRGLNALSLTPWGESLVLAFAHPRFWDDVFVPFWKSQCTDTGSRKALFSCLESRQVDPQHSGHHRAGIIRDNISFVAVMRKPWRKWWNGAMGQALAIVVIEGEFMVLKQGKLRPGDAAIVSMTEENMLKDVVGTGTGILMLIGMKQPGLGPGHSITLSTGSRIAIVARGDSAVDLDLDASTKVVPQDPPLPLDMPKIKLSADTIKK